jgi:CelD/BcsL family acetyltransferase involved in cellulose biosynthesis
MNASLGQLLSPVQDIESEAQDAAVNSLPRKLSPVPGRPVQRLSPNVDERWDSRLAANAGCSFFQGTAWAKVLQQTYGYEANYFATLAGEHLDGLLPVMEVDSWLTGRRGVSLPFTDYCDPLAAKLSAFQELFDQAVQYGRDRHWKYLELRGGKQFLSTALPSQRFYGHELALEDDEKELSAALAPAVRRAIRKAERQGLTVEILQDAKGIKEFYSLQCQTRRKHGLPPQPFKFFENLQKYVLAEGGGIIILARFGARSVAGSIFFHAGRQAIYKFGASDEGMLELRGNDLVMWEGIKYYASKGFRTLHLGRTSLAHEGLRRFKLGWGAREHSMEYFKYDLRKSAFVTARDEAFGWYNRLFAALPLSLSRLLGAVLYRHVA